jgi:hypothetical protein
MVRYAATAISGAARKNQLAPSGQRLVAERLGQVVARLPDPEPAASLQPRLDLGDHAGHAGRADRDGQDLQQLDEGYRGGLRSPHSPMIIAGRS